MAGFSNVSSYTEAYDSGQTWLTQFKKTVPSVTTTQNGYLDFSYFAGSPLANFYASTPLEAAYVATTRGIYVRSVSPAKQFLKNITFMAVDRLQNATEAARQEVMLCDYLMYYPFVDTGSLDQQDMTQSVTLPRYDYGRVMCVAQSSSGTTGQFTMNYTNQDGVSGRVSPNIFIRPATAGGLLINSDAAASGYTPFVQLQAGDTGVQSIESATFTASGGGLIALVIVKPLFKYFSYEGCRTQTSGVTGAYGSPVSIDTFIHHKVPVEIKDGAILNLLINAHGGSIPTTAHVGYIETIWN